MNIAVFAIDPRSIDQILEAFLLIGNVLGVPDRSEKTGVGVENQACPGGKKSRLRETETRGFFSRLQTNRLSRPARDSYIDKMITLAGGRNLAAEMQGYPKFSWEDILAMQPEVILISSMIGGKTS